MVLSPALRALWLNHGWPLVMAVGAAVLPLLQASLTSENPFEAKPLLTAAASAAIAFFLTRFNSQGHAGASWFIPKIEPNQVPAAKEAGMKSPPSDVNVPGLITADTPTVTKKKKGT